MSTENEDLNAAAGAPEGGAAEPASLHDQLTAAFADASAGDDAPAVGVPAAAPDQAQAAQTNSQPRTDKGQFAPKPAAVQNATSQPATQQAGGEAPPAPIVPPASWSAAAKTKFGQLPPDIQQEVAKRERDIEQGLAQQQTKAERLNRLDEILSPRQQRFHLAGLNEIQAINALFAAQDMLEQRPVEALLFLAQQRGVGPQDLMNALGGARPAAQPMDPRMQALAQQVQVLTNAQVQQQAVGQQQARRSVDEQIAAFKADPANIYFANVQERMAKLITAGAADNLQDAYQQACWADPDIRPLMLQQQQPDPAAAARAKAEQARRASGSVIGSPTPGAAPSRSGPPLSLEDELRAAFAAAS